MATPTSTPEASELKRRGRQRLIGAVVLVLLLVVFVPMLLDSEPRPARDTPALAIPPKDAAAPLAAPSAAPAPSADTPKPDATKVAAPADAPAEVAKTDAAKGEPAKLDTARVDVAKASPPTPAKAAPAVAPKLEGFAVQVGASRNEDKLRQAKAKLEAAKVAHYTERLEVKAGPLTRLRAGPFATRDLAEAGQVAVRRAGLEGKVVPLP